MYETVKTVNGYEITRMVGSRGFYIVRITGYSYMTFKTIKAAAEFCNGLDAKEVK